MLSSFRALRYICSNVNKGDRSWPQQEMFRQVSVNNFFSCARRKANKL